MFAPNGKIKIFSASVIRLTDNSVRYLMQKLPHVKSLSLVEIFLEILKIIAHLCQIQLSELSSLITW
jgi:hypothetical protein